MESADMVDGQDVLIVGGGVVGLSAALFLQRYGVQPLLVERHRGTSIHPRARGVNVRVMELYRAIGLEARVREAGRATPISLGILQGETLAGAMNAPVGRWVRAGLNALARRHLFRPSGSPSAGCRVTQDHLEPVLAEAARERGAELLFSTELTTFEQDATGLTAELHDRRTGERRRVRARYLVAADGARSPIRQRLGVGTSGAGTFGHLLNVLFEADLAGLVRGREFSMALIHRPEVRGLFAAIDNRARWVFHILYDARRESPQDYPPARCAELIRLALGAGEVGIDIKSVLPWECAARVADRYRVGRVLLAGDAAHLLPPWGGLGANTGIADAWDLAWKLARVCKGEADDELLDSYQVERRPLAVIAAEDSAANTDPQGLMAPFSWRRLFGNAASGPRPPGPGKLFKLAGLGWQYRSSFIAEETPASDEEKWRLDGRPGTRLPHGWLTRAGQRISSLDLAADRYALLLGQSSPNERGIDGRSLDSPIDVWRAGTDFQDPGNRWQRAAGIFPDGALLVRPDGVVAWRARGGTPVAEARASLQRAWRALSPPAARSAGGDPVPSTG